MSLLDAVKTCLQKYVTFSGRARRSEYWYFALFAFLVGLVAGVVDSRAGNEAFSTICSLALLLPSLAVSVRRLHDTGRSGGWYFIVLIPIVGVIMLVVFSCLDTEPGSNRFGTDPKHPQILPEPQYPQAFPAPYPPAPQFGQAPALHYGHVAHPSSATPAYGQGAPSAPLAAPAPQQYGQVPPPAAPRFGQATPQADQPFQPPVGPGQPGQ